jgi:hypothetical protein
VRVAGALTYEQFAALHLGVCMIMRSLRPRSSGFNASRSGLTHARLMMACRAFEE